MDVTYRQKVQRAGKLILKILGLAIFLLPMGGVLSATAGKADILAVEVTKSGGGTYTFVVTVQHKDTGWDHYADRWEILSLDGTMLAKRVLLHPHVDEQPFTRSLRGVTIPKGIRQVRIRAHDNVHGFGGLEKEVMVPD
ncbi:MAG: hypothetical protein ACE5JQ_07915 [Candidatus Methylomirabilales bacterium]